MKETLVFVLVFLTTHLWSQEVESYQFEGGTKVDFLLIKDNPNELHDWSVSANVNALGFGLLTSGWSVVGNYNISKNLSVGANLGISNYSSSEVPDRFSSSSFLTSEIFPEIRYQFKSISSKDDRNVVVKTTGNYNNSTTYQIKRPFEKLVNFSLDGGINYSSFNVHNNFFSNDDSDYHIFGSKVTSLSLGASRIRSFHYRYSIDNKVVKSYLKSSRLSFKLLLGAPLAKSIVRESKLDSMIELDPPSGYELPKFYNLGFRLNYDVIRSFKLKPEIFFTFGGGLGIHPSYKPSPDLYTLMNGTRLFYYSFRLGIGFGKKPY